MFGLDMGSLDVFVAGHGLEHIVWRMSGYKGPEWRFGEVLILLRGNDKVGNTHRFPVTVMNDLNDAIPRPSRKYNNNVFTSELKCLTNAYVLIYVNVS